VVADTGGALFTGGALSAGSLRRQVVRQRLLRVRTPAHAEEQLEHLAGEAVVVERLLVCLTDGAQEAGAAAVAQSLQVVLYRLEHHQPAESADKIS